MYTRIHISMTIQHYITVYKGIVPSDMHVASIDKLSSKISNNDHSVPCMDNEHDLQTWAIPSLTHRMCIMF